MKVNNLKKISDKMDKLELGLRSYFSFIQKRQVQRNCHGVYKAIPFGEQYNFRVTLSEMVPPDLSVWDNVDHLFVIHGNTVRVYEVSILKECLIERKELCTVDPLHLFVIDNEKRVVRNRYLTIPFKNVEPTWSKYPLRFLQEVKKVYAIRISEGIPAAKLYNSYKEAANALDISVDQIKNNLRGSNTVIKAIFNGDEISVSFLSCEQYEYFATNQSEGREWYKARQELKLNNRKRKVRSDTGKKHELTMDQIERDKMIISMFIQANRERLDELRITKGSIGEKEVSGQ